MGKIERKYMTRYEIKSYKQETECSWCAYPLYVRDYAFLDEKIDRVFCSETCQKKYLEMKSSNNLKRKEKKK
jgi:hypothetical protein